MSIQVLFFGPLTEVTGVHKELVEQATTLRELSEALNARYPGLERQSYKWAINEAFVNHIHHPLKEGDQVALLPPFAGG